MEEQGDRSKFTSRPHRDTQAGVQRARDFHVRHAVAPKNKHPQYPRDHDHVTRRPRVFVWNCLRETIN